MDIAIARYKHAEWGNAFKGKMGVDVAAEMMFFNRRDTPLHSYSSVYGLQRVGRWYSSRGNQYISIPGIRVRSSMCSHQVPIAKSVNTPNTEFLKRFSGGLLLVEKVSMATSKRIRGLVPYYTGLSDNHHWYHRLSHI